MEHCGMQVVYGDLVFDNVVAEVIGLPVGKAPYGSHHPPTRWKSIVGGGRVRNPLLLPCPVNRWFGRIRLPRPPECLPTAHAASGP